MKNDRHAQRFVGSLKPKPKWGDFQMSISRTLVGFCLGAALSSLVQGIAQTPKVDDVLAKINGRVVTHSELDQKEAGRLLQPRYDYYHAQREALDQVINDELLQREASHRGVTVQQLLDQEVASKVKDPTEDQLEVYYEGLQTDQTFDAVRGQILATLRQSRTNKAQAAFLTSLRKQAKIQILLVSPRVDVALGDAPARGKKDAPVIMVEFADFECPFCQQIQPELDKLLKEYDGKLTFVLKDLPLPIHPHAEKAAEAARCAGDQGAFWAYHDILFRERNNLEVAQLKEDARALGLDTTRFNQCVDSGQQAAAIQKDFMQAQQLGLTGTPGFFVNGHYFSGVVSYETLREFVEQQLTAATSSN
jgi:protein-disulfide isomerase